ncbi:MAG: penicillin-binding protein 1B [Gammaproteobacteria bacterium]
MNAPEQPAQALYARLSSRRRLIAASLYVLVAGAAVYIAWLGHIVTREFEGRRWTVPAQVYAQPLELYPGLSLSADAIEQELKRLGYRRASDPVEPGTYRRRGSRVDVMLRKARFADEVRDAQPLRIVADERGIMSLQGRDGEDQTVVRLDPLLIGSLFPVHGEDRIVVGPDEVPPLLPQALKIVEDRNFDSHNGIDLRAILRAAWVNLRAGKVEQGGSTLTQQLVKSFFLDEQRTFRRKAREAAMAVILEGRFEKAEIMNAYVNEIYLGQDGNRAIHGFGLASRFYFGKPLAELELPELALLVGIVRGPSYYNPRAHPKRAKERRDFVLERLAKFEVIPEKDAKTAIKQPLGVAPRGKGSGQYLAYLELVRRTLRRDYREEDLTQEGLQIFTSLDPRVQAAAERAIDEQLVRLDRRQKSKKRPLEGALVVTTPQSGEVVALVGGRQMRLTGFNRALDAKRSIGSLAKPIVYLAALESGRYHAASLVYDEPVEVRLRNGEHWRPQNFDQETLGPLPVVRALAESRNLATVQLGLDVGLAAVAEKFNTLGLDREPARVPALLLGAAELAPIEVAQVYNALANGGFHTPLRAVQAVKTSEGRTLKAFSLEVTTAADPAAVYQLNRMLAEVMTHGTGRAAAARLPAGLITAGKTGTSSDFRDSWFAGFSGSHLIVVWVGHDDNSPTGLTGSQGALPVWSTVMREIGPRSWDAAMPETLEEAWVEYSSGLATEPGCAEDVIGIAVPRGTQLDFRDGCDAPGFDYFAERLIDWFRGAAR